MKKATLGQFRMKLNRSLSIPCYVSSLWGIIGPVNDSLAGSGFTFDPERIELPMGKEDTAQTIIPILTATDEAETGIYLSLQLYRMPRTSHIEVTAYYC